MSTVSWRRDPKTGCLVSPEGVVLSPYHGKVLNKMKTTSGGFYACAVQVKGRRVWLYPHLTVMALYGPPKPSEQHIVAFRDFNKANFRIDNLMWLTRSQNLRRLQDAGRLSRVRLGPEKTLEIRKAFETGATMRSLASRYGVDITSIRAAVRGYTYVDSLSTDPS